MEVCEMYVRVETLHHPNLPNKSDIQDSIYLCISQKKV